MVELTAEEAVETICEHINNPTGIIERISTWSQEKIKKFFFNIKKKKIKKKKKKKKKNKIFF